MTTDPDPEPQAAIAAALRLLSDARQAARWRAVCVGCQRLYAHKQATTTDPVLCQSCTAIWEQRR